MNVLVTGGTGFIGSAVVDCLRANQHKVTTFDRTQGQDIRNKIDVAEAVQDNDAVIHLAGILGTDELFDDIDNAVDINVKGSINVLNACTVYGAKYIGITMPPVFPSIYTATKVSSGRFAMAYHHNFGVPVTHVRAFNVFGAKQHHGPGHPRKIIPAFSVEGWNKIPLKIWGDGTQMVDLIHADDVARVFLHALDAPGNDEIIDAGTGIGWTVTEVAEFVADTTGYDGPFNYQPMRRGEIPTKVVSPGLGWEHLNGWTPTLDRIQLIKTIVAYREYEIN